MSFETQIWALLEHQMKFTRFLIEIPYLENFHPNFNQKYKSCAQKAFLFNPLKSQPY